MVCCGSGAVTSAGEVTQAVVVVVGSPISVTGDKRRKGLTDTTGGQLVVRLQHKLPAGWPLQIYAVHKIEVS